MTTPCMPAETAENGSLHWVESPTRPKKFSVRVLVWGARQKLFQNTENYRYVSTIGWRYIGPASPNEATELATALAQNAKLENEVKDTWAQIETMTHDYTMKVEAAGEEITALRAQIAALEASAAEMRADAERFRWLLSEWDNDSIPVFTDCISIIGEDGVRKYIDMHRSGAKL